MGSFSTGALWLTNVREKSVHAIYFLVQITGLIWVVAGYGYHLAVTNLVLTPQSRNLLAFLIIFGPGL